MDHRQWTTDDRRPMRERVVEYINKAKQLQHESYSQKILQSPMIIVQLTGLPAAGKTTLSNIVKEKFEAEGRELTILDGDAIRKTIHTDLGFSEQDRKENIRRLGVMANALRLENKMVIIAAINPFEEIRNELKNQYHAKTVWLKCSLHELMKRDPKGLYRRALLPDNDAEKIVNLSGVNQDYEQPANPDLVIDTENNSIESASMLLFEFIKNIVD
jgi:adenylylsulfate kinase